MSEGSVRRVKKLERVLEVGKSLMAVADREELLRVMVHASSEVLDADRSTLFLVMPDRGEIWSKVAEGAEVQEIRLPIGAGVAGQVVRNGKLVNLTDAYKDARFFPGVDQRTGYRTRSILCAPVRGRAGAVLGALEALNKKGEGGFTREDEEFINVLASYCALALENAEQADRLLRENLTLRRKLEASEAPVEIVGRSTVMQELLRRVDRAAPTPSNVLLLGESGTGKELLARRLHHMSPRRSHPFVRLSCAAIPAGLLESELFGHERGAFTGAVARKAGLFEVADGGSLFLDEIGEIPLALQGKLLRALQEREILRLGATRPRSIDVRVIAATNRNLEALVAEGQFRQDLFYRLNVISLVVPPLREREGDVELLAEFFLDQMRRETTRRVRGFRPDAFALLGSHRWPGNVRELGNVVERAVVLGNSEWVEAGDLEIRLEAPPAQKLEQPLAKVVAELERAHILRALSDAGGRKSLAARALGMNRTTFLYKLKKLNAPV